MKNLIAFNLFLFLILFAFNSHAACEEGQFTKLVTPQEVTREDMNTGNVTITKLPAGFKVHVADISDEKDNILIYAMRGTQGKFIGAVANFNPNKEIVLTCQKSQDCQIF